MSDDIWVKESPIGLALGEAIAYVFDFADVGAADPSAAGITLAYDALGEDKSSTVLSGSASLSGARVTAKKLTPASAQRYTLIQPATIDGNTIYLGVKIDVYDPKK
jgi:hypothetical protein